jgi:hypothetical protein
MNLIYKGKRKTFQAYNCLKIFFNGTSKQTSAEGRKNEGNERKKKEEEKFSQASLADLARPRGRRLTHPSSSAFCISSWKSRSTFFLLLLRLQMPPKKRENGRRSRHCRRFSLSFFLFFFPLGGLEKINRSEAIGNSLHLLRLRRLRQQYDGLG